MPRESVIDTVILQKANAPITHTPVERRLFFRRIQLLKQVADGTLVLLMSKRLLQEYSEHVLIIRNEYIKAFFELLDRRDRIVWNWTRRWSGGQRAAARACRYPVEDDHLLRTAIRTNESQILTEERRLIKVDDGVFRVFRVHIRDLP